MSNVSEEERKEQRQRNEEFLSRLFKLQTQVNKGIAEGTHDAEKFARVLQNFMQKPQEELMAILDKESYLILGNGGNSATLSRLIREGKYHWFDEDINSTNFHFRKDDYNGEVELELVSFRVHEYQSILNQDAFMGIGAQGLKPANLVHLLRFCLEYPEIQRRSIVALGSYWVWPIEDRPCFPYVEFTENQHELHLNKGGDGNHWNRDTCFLAVRE